MNWNTAEVLQEEEENEDEEGLQEVIFGSQHECPCCQERILYTDEVFLLEVVEAAQDNGELQVQALLCDDGDYQFMPFVLHFSCWEEVLECIREEREDEPPVEHPEGILVCSCCESTIGPFEPFVAATCGRAAAKCFAHSQPAAQSGRSPTRP